MLSNAHQKIAISAFQMSARAGFLLKFSECQPTDLAHFVENTMKKYFVLLAAGLLQAGASATTTYHFTSAPYKTPIFNHTDNCASGTCADFTAAMAHSGSFTLNTKLGPNLVHVDVSSDMTSYSFSDGTTPVFASKGIQERLMSAFVSTDAVGNITASDIVVMRWQTANHLAGGRLDSITAGAVSYANGICNAVSSPGRCTQVVGDASTSQAAIGPGGPGWNPVGAAIASVPVDNPFALLLTGIGVIGLTLRCRQKLATVRLHP